jgi:hypothetical protein
MGLWHGMPAALVSGLQRLQMYDLRGAVATSLSLPPAPPLDAASWAQTPLVVRPWCVHLLAVIQPQAVRVAALDARVPQRSGHADRPLSANPPYEKPTARSGGQGTLGIARRWWHHGVINVKPQACSCGQAECPDTRPSDSHQIIERPEIQMPVSLLFLNILLPLQSDGGLVMDARICGQVPHPWSRWQARMLTQDHASCRREALRTAVVARQGQIAECIATDEV